MSVELVFKLKLKAENQTEQRILDYLNQNASDVLVEKINAGTKTLAGAVRYATAEAKKLGTHDGCVCVDDATVFGWIIHFFEEDEITEPKKEKAAVKLPGRVKKQTEPTKPTKRTKQTADDGEQKPEDPKPEKPKGLIFPELFSNEELSGAKR
jgi:hypothetical protein